MLADIHYLDELPPILLDTYLDKGWFRLGQAIFTTHFLKFNHQIYSNFWLRINLSKFELSKTQTKLLKQNAHFEVIIQRTNLTNAHENLFQQYKSSIKFSTAQTVQSLLYDNGNNSIFDEYEVLIYDKGQLIAVGFFDIGKKSVEGITCFYDPTYKKYSLGKYLMLQKILFCLEHGFTYFYPGYIAPGYPLFDYKLDLAKNATDFYDFISESWLPMARLDKENTPLKIIKEKIFALSNLFSRLNIKHFVVYYDHFDINLIATFSGLGLLDAPMMLIFEDLIPNQLPIICYDVINQQYQFLVCLKSFSLNQPLDISGHYTNYVLKPTHLRYSDNSMVKFAHQILLQT